MIVDKNDGNNRMRSDCSGRLRGRTLRKSWNEIDMSTKALQDDGELARKRAKVNRPGGEKACCSLNNWALLALCVSVIGVPYGDREA